MNRDFKGVWIPKEIYLNKGLNWTDKILLIEITSLDGEKGCFASNAHFAEFLGVKETAISKSISKLKKLGFIHQSSFDGRKRILKTGKSALSKKTSLPCPKEQGCDVVDDNHNNTVNKPINNTVNLKKEFPPLKNEKYRPLSEGLKVFILEACPTAKITDDQVASWCNDFRLMVEQDNRTESFLQDAIIEFFKDPFWCKNIKSAGKLRVQINNGRLDEMNNPKTTTQFGRVEQSGDKLREEMSSW